MVEEDGDCVVVNVDSYVVDEDGGGVVDIEIVMWWKEMVVVWLLIEMVMWLKKMWLFGVVIMGAAVILFNLFSNPSR